MNNLITALKGLETVCRNEEEFIIADDMHGKILCLSSDEINEQQKGTILHELHDMCTNELSAIASKNETNKKLIDEIHALSAAK